MAKKKTLEEDKRSTIYDCISLRSKNPDINDEEIEKTIEMESKILLVKSRGLHDAKHDVDPKKKILEEIGNLDTLRLSGAQVLVATYIRPNKIGSIYITDKVQDEDKFQGKCGLVLKRGPLAFKSTPKIDFGGYDAKPGAWVWYRPMDGYALSVNGVHCRVLDDVEIKGDIDNPDVVL